MARQVPLVLQLDYHKTLHVPRVPAQDCYFRKRLAVRSFGIYEGNRKLMHCFIYPETVSGEGPDEVISLLDCLLKKITQDGDQDYEHLIVYADNSPSQFKENYLFFYCCYLVKIGRFKRIDVKFLLEGHTLSICDRRFGSLESFGKRIEIVETPSHWALLLKDSELERTEVYYVTREMVKDFKGFLKNEYHSRNTDMEGKVFKVRDIAWMSFGYGEALNSEGQVCLKQLKAGESLIRTTFDYRQPPILVNYTKKKQCTPLEGLSGPSIKHDSEIAVPLDVKNNCVTLARKYLSTDAQRFYQNLSVIECDNRGNSNAT